MSPRLLQMVSALLCGVIFLAPVHSQQPRPRPQPGDTTDQERRLANLEKQLEVLRQQIDELRKDLKAKPAVGKADLRIFALKHVAAADMAKTLQAMLGEPTKIRIVADPQTNSVLVAAPDEEAATIQKLITQLDVVVAKTKPADNTPLKPETRIFPLKNAAAGEMAGTLKALFGGADKTICIAVDDATNTVIVLAPSDVLATIEAVLGRLDAVRETSPVKPEIRVFLLKNLEPAPTAKVLREIFPADQYKMLRLSVSEQTNSVVVAGSIPDLMAIEALLGRLESTAKEKKTEKVPHEH